MTEIIAIALPPEYYNLQVNQLIQINDQNPGRAIVIGLIIEYLLGTSTGTDYLYCKQFLKTKLINLNMHQADNLNNFNNLFSLTSIGDFIEYCKTPDFYKYLGDLGQNLVGNYYNNLDFINIHEISKDLNIKLSLYEGTELVAEGKYYQFRNAPTVNIISEKNTNHEYFFPYLFQRSEDTSQPIPYSEDKVDTKKKSLNEFGWALGEIAEDVYLRKAFKNWLADILKKYSGAQSNYSFLRRLKVAKMRTGKLPQLRTANLNIAELKTSQSYNVKMPEMYQKFAPIPEESVLPEMRVKKKKQEAKGGEENIEENKNVEEVKVAPAAQHVPEKKPVSGDLGVHCDKCLNDPCPFGTLSCKCLLSFECMGTSFQNQKCVSCSKPVTQSDFNEFREYFS